MKGIALSLLVTLAIILGTNLIKPELFKNRSVKTKAHKSRIESKPVREKTLEDIANEISLEEGIHPKLIRTIISIESSWKPKAVSKVGAIGLVQIMPANASWCRVSVRNLYHPIHNLKCGIRLLKDNLRRFKGDRVKALRAYNASSRCLTGKCKSVEKYVKKILDKFGHSTPILITDT